MRYFRNTELARLYDVSEKSVRNWVKQAQTGKLDLDLYAEQNGKTYLADTTKNILAIEKLVEHGKKYRNSLTHKVVSPTAEFYEIYSWPQIYDIVSNLEKFNEFPFHYAHMGKGADICAQYYDRLRAESILNPQSFSDNFLKHYEIGIMDLFPAESNVNVVELGSRTGLTTRDFIDKIQAKGRLGAYVAVDLSDYMLAKNRANVTTWFKDSITYRSYQRDILRERFDDIIIENSSDSACVKNLVLLFGGTLYAFNDRKAALNNIRASIGSDDYFMVSTKLDSEIARRYFDFNPSYQDDLLPLKELFLINNLNIEETFYDVEQFYDEKERQRVIQVRLKFDVTVKFKLQQGTKSIHFKKGEAIMLWRFWHQTMEEIVQELSECGFSVMQAVKSPDEQFAMVVAKVKTNKDAHR